MNELEIAQHTFSVLDHLPLGVLVLRQDLVVVFWNRCLEEWTGLARSTLVGMPIHGHFPHFQDPQYTTGLQHIFAGGPPTVLLSPSHQHLITAPLPNGQMRRLQTTVTLAPSAASSGCYALLTVQDVTEQQRHVDDCQIAQQHADAERQARERLEAQLCQTQKLEAIGTLAGGIAHDFNNMLSAILGFAELAVDDIPAESTVQYYLQHILTAGRRARDLVQQILTFCRQHNPRRQPIQLHLLVKEALKMLRASLPVTIAIESHIETTSSTVIADPTQMHQVLVNLCTNAEYAMRETGGTLDVSLATVEVDALFATAHQPLRPGPHIRLTVRDTGHGMPQEVLEHIFEPFFTTKNVGEGTGMGLAIVHSIVLNHGGAVTVESTPGQGTTFEIYLPCSKSAVGVAARLEEAIPSGHYERILFVDDEIALTHLGQAMLDRLGYRAVVRTSASEALQLFRAAPHQFDLVITDQTMPQMTGETFVRELRHIRPDIPVILCTGFSHTMTAEKARALGIDALLMKPLVTGDLGRAIQRVLMPRAA